MQNIQGVAGRNLEQTSSEHYLLILEEQFDVVEFSRDFNGRGKSLANRHQTVIEELKDIASLSQPTIIDALDLLKLKGSVFRYTPFFISNIIAVECLPGTREDLERISGVARVEVDEELVLIHPVEAESVRSDSDGALDEIITPRGLYDIRANMAWDLGFSGNGVLVANLDTGVDGAHPALASHWRGSLGYPASECWLDLTGTIYSTPHGHQSHGSQTMGIMCGMTPGDTIGVAWGAMFIGAEIEFGLHLVSQALQAFEWMLDPDGNPETFADVPRVISNSWGMPAGSNPCSDLFSVAIDNCEAAGTAVVWAAGNSGPVAGSISNPADITSSSLNTFSVGGWDYTTGEVWSGSSRGPSFCTMDTELRIKPEIIAPSRNIKSARLGGGYIIETGTSFAAPHIAGTIALMLEANPSLDPDSLKELLVLTSVDGGVDGNDNDYGHGVLDAYTAVYSALTGIGWVDGFISDEIGNPIQAEIYLPDHPHHFQSDAQGYFVLAMPAWLPFQIQVVVPSKEIYTAWLQLDPQDTLRHDIDLIPSLNGAVTGTVIDCFGLPSAGIMVEALNTTISPTFTDANGRFLLSLPAGFYNIRASTPQCGQTTVSGIQVIIGGVTDIEIVLPLNPSFICGNPDSYGYRVCDHNDPNGPIYDWIELSPSEGGLGIALNLIDDESQQILLPFPVQFYGTVYDWSWVIAIGNLSFGYSIFNYTNLALPSLLGPAVYAFWDDLDDNVIGNSGSILARYQPEIAAFIVEWYQVPRYRSVGTDVGNATFEIIIYDQAVVQTGSGNTVFEAMYGEIDTTNSCTIGLDADDGSGYIRYVHNGTYETHATPITNGLAVRFADGSLLEQSTALTVYPATLEISLEPGQILDTSLTLNNAGSGSLGYTVSIGSENYTSVATGSESPAVDSGKIHPSLPKDLPIAETKGFDFVRSPIDAALDAGGPDSYGYYWIDSRDAGGPAFSFNSIVGIGNESGVVEDDMSSDPIDLPWDFEFYGQRFRQFTINSNGFISFWSVCVCYQDRTLIESPIITPFYIIAPMWDDLDPSAGGQILTYYDSAADRFIIQWEAIIRWNRPSTASTFQIILYPDGMIDLVYEDITSNTIYATVGMKGGNSGEATQLSSGQNYLSDNVLVRIYLPNNLASDCRILDHSFGVIPPGESRIVPIRIANNSQSNGSQNWPVTVRSTDPFASVLRSDVYMISPGAIDANLTVASENENITLYWKSFPTSYYCVYSGGPNDEELTYFEGMTADTFFTISTPVDFARMYEIRLCTAAAGQQP